MTHSQKATNRKKKEKSSQKSNIVLEAMKSLSWSEHSWLVLGEREAKKKFFSHSTEWRKVELGGKMETENNNTFFEMVGSERNIPVLQRVIFCALSSSLFLSEKCVSICHHSSRARSMKHENYLRDIFNFDFSERFMIVYFHIPLNERFISLRCLTHPQS